ncbi:hypothetical protein [Xenorhabdus bovienii]|uniref:hypothetical protein n=1 Tax=Xenorhabdus bovienii TaxID=40576 RepID=UPI000B2375A9|nr:hypothetical protein [Xenorhabdus bovienii]MDE9429814.1 hypothetical protein [Xenorhabdus bovienii]
MQRGWGGEVKTEAAGRPAYRVVGQMRAGQLKKNADCQGLAQPLRAEGAALCGGTSAMPISEGADIM